MKTKESKFAKMVQQSTRNYENSHQVQTQTQTQTQLQIIISSIIKTVAEKGGQSLRKKLIVVGYASTVGLGFLSGPAIS